MSFRFKPRWIPCLIVATPLLASLLNSCGPVPNANSHSSQSAPSLPIMAPPLALLPALDFGSNFQLGLLAGEGDSDFAEGASDKARFSYPWDVTLKANGEIVVVDRFNHRLRKLTPSGEVSTLAGDRAPGHKDGLALNSQFDNPVAVVSDLKGHLYVADSGNHVIRKVSATGEVSTLAGTPGKAGFKDGLAQAGQFSSPSGLALDLQGNLYIADSNNNRIRKLSADGKTLSTIAGSAQQGFQDGSALDSRFFSPRDLVFNAQGELYVSDGFNHAIRKLSADGKTLTTVVGNGEPGNREGKGSAARLSEPVGLALDAGGTLFIADSGNNQIKTLSPNGELKILAGNGEGRYKNGPLRESSLASPRGLTLYAGGLYIADTQNHRLRKLGSP